MRPIYRGRRIVDIVGSKRCEHASHS